MTGEAAVLFYGSCVALGKNAAILTGPSGSGKSDLALRFIFQTPAPLSPALVSDDQIRLEARNGHLTARPPESIAGQIEVRGIGIVDIPYCEEAEVKLLVQLVDKEIVPRLPPAPLLTRPLCGIDVPLLLLSALESSAPLKLRLALQYFIK